jgi:hypothetical protein
VLKALGVLTALIVLKAPGAVGQAKPLAPERGYAHSGS